MFFSTGLRFMRGSFLALLQFFLGHPVKNETLPVAGNPDLKRI
jgi:hypothetical protein